MWCGMRKPHLGQIQNFLENFLRNLRVILKEILAPPFDFYGLAFRNLIFHCSWKRIHVNRPCPDIDSRVFLFIQAKKMEILLTDILK